MLLRRFHPETLLGIALFIVLARSSFAAHVDAWSLTPENPQPGSEVVLNLSGVWPSTCTPTSHEVEWVSPVQATVLLHHWPKGCGGALTPWQRSIPLGALGEGEYLLEVLTYGPTGPPPAPLMTIATIGFSILGVQAIPTLSVVSFGIFAVLLAFLAARRL